MSFFRFLAENRLFLLAGFLLSFTSSYGQTFFISLFAGEIMAEFALTDGQWGAIYTIATTASAIVMVWAGAWTDRLRIRALARIVMLGLAVACLTMAAVPNAWLLIGVIFLLRFFGQGMMSHLAVVAMARWFIATRGKALSISATGFAAGTAILPVIFAALLLEISWRWLWVIAASLVLVMLPVIARLLRQERTPQSLAESDQSTGMSGRHWTRGEVIRHPVFWLLIPALIGPPTWGTALFFQQVHLTEVKGWSLVAYTALFPLISLVTVTFSLLSGQLIDRIGATRLMPLFMIPYGLVFVIMAQAETLTGAAIALTLFGVCQGIQSTVPSAFWAEIFGTRHIGSIKAVAGAIMVFGSAIGPGITGLFIDLGVDFPGQMIPIGLYFLVAAALAWLAIRRVGPMSAAAA